MAVRFSELSQTLRDLTAMSMSLDHQVAMILERTAETGGMVKLPQPGNSWDNQALEISLHGVFAVGSDWPEAIRNWQRAARTQVAGAVA